MKLGRLLLVRVPAEWDTTTRTYNYLRILNRYW